jgi:hypothetical protein
MFFVDQIGRQVCSLLSSQLLTLPTRTAVLFGIACSAVVILARAGAAIGF